MQGHTPTRDTPLPIREITFKATRTKVQMINLITRALLDHCTGIKCQNTLIVTGQDNISIQTEHGIEILRRDMETTYEEADAIIPQQIHMAKQSRKVQNFKVICDGTDIFVLLLYYYVTQEWTGDMLLESLVEGQPLISIKKTAEKHGPITSCLPAMHALTSCDNVPRIFGIGKVSPLNILRKNPLNHLGNLDALPEVMTEEANTFVPRCYGAKNSVEMAELRFVCSTKFIL